QQLAKTSGNEEIFAVYVIAKYDDNTSSYVPKVQKVLQDFADVFPETLPN
ncbi:4568_t:CDS:1, partial [Racocetra fulgida]